VNIVLGVDVWAVSVMMTDAELEMSEHHLIIGGNAAGMTAASRAKRLDPSLSVTILEASRYISYGICGLPYCLGGVVSSFDELIYYTPESLRNERGIDARTETRAVEILPARRSVVAEDIRTGERDIYKYDKLLIATGYRPVTPPLERIDAKGVFTVSRIEDGQAISDWLAKGEKRRAVLVGGGYVSLVMAEALRRRGLDVTLVENSPAIFSALDPDMAELVQKELEANGVEVLTHREVGRILNRECGAVQAVELAQTKHLLHADIVFVDVGVEPQVDLAMAAGLQIGPSGAIVVSDRMETSVPAIYAAGNCAETVHLVTGRPVMAPLGSVAVKQGRVAGENMAGRISRFQGVVGTTAVKVFDVSAARTGLTSAEAKREGFRVVEAKIQSRFRAPYFAEGEPATVKVIADESSARLLGAQIVGCPMAAVRIDVAATALSSQMRVDEVAQLDLAYTPPLGALWNPLLIAMNALTRKMEGRL
jgi:NADPH-dependent 2,4-dienoyl-CoA reductase/sulfur reductase-like enzyme